MKRKRSVEQEENIATKKLKSEVKDSKAGTSSDGVKSRKCKNDSFSQNGRVLDDNKLNTLANDKGKVEATKKKQTVAPVSDEGKEVPKKKRGRKPAVSQAEANNETKPQSPQSVLKTSNKKKQVQQSEPAHVAKKDTSVDDQKRSKKRVRIDETESLKVKKELAEPHFSAKQLPAKIIKSKSNKNLTEEVKVSPVTVQNVKNEKKHKFSKEELDNAELVQVDSDSDHDENGTNSSEESDLEIYYINKNAEKKAKEKATQPDSPIMSKEDQLVLVQRVQEVIPEDDTKNYKYRMQHLDWLKVAFKDYTVDDCQKVWSQLLKKVRHYRTLSEVAGDIRQVIEENDLKALTGNKKSGAKRHPDMPKRPLSSYLLYYIREREKLSKERPDLTDTADLNKYISEKYQNLPPEKKQKYEMLATKNKEEYKRQLEEFYSKHPEMKKAVIKKYAKPKTEKPPKRPDNPFKLFLEAEIVKKNISDEEKTHFKEICREKWRQMPDSKKVVWINKAEEYYKKYEEELREYMAKYPEYIPKNTHKPLLSREELKLKDKLAGKPKKPPGTAYGLFIRMQSNEMTNIPNRERWNYTSAKWKAMSEAEREHYKTLLEQVHEQYEKDFDAYLQSLPEEQRQEEILKNLPKKRKSEKPASNVAKAKATAAAKSKAKGGKAKIENPIPPPRSVFKFFAEKHQGDNPKQAWKKLSSAEKQKYEEELVARKVKYIQEFEAYLKSLTKAQLAAFCANRKSRETEEDSSSDDSPSESEHGDEDSSDASSNSDSENDSEDN